MAMSHAGQCSVAIELQTVGSMERGTDLKRTGFGWPSMSSLNSYRTHTATQGLQDNRSTKVKLEKEISKGQNEWQKGPNGWAQCDFRTAEECAMSLPPRCHAINSTHPSRTASLKHLAIHVRHARDKVITGRGFC